MHSTSTALYPALLGTSWMELHENVRQMHVEDRPIHATGTFVVRRGGNRLMRWLGRLAGLPAAGNAVPVTLAILPENLGEQWRRSFAGRPMFSRQWARRDGLLAEQMGRLELRYRLEIVAGALHYRPVRAGLRLGPLFVPLPRCLAPRMDAREASGDEPGRVFVRVEVSLPLLGLLVAYRGTIVRQETNGP